MAGERITDPDELLVKGGEAGIIPGPVTPHVYYNGWAYDEEDPDPGYGYRVETKTVPRPNYNGGSAWVGEQATQEDIDTYANSSLVLGYIAGGLNLAKLATGQFAQLDFKKDIRSAKEKLNQAQASASAQINALNTAGQNITGLAQRIDDLRQELQDFANEMSSLMVQINSFQPILQSLSSSLNSANSELGSANANLVSVQASRGSYPQGTKGTQAYNNAVKNAQSQVTSAKTAVNNASKALASAKDDANEIITEYNDVSGVATPKATELVDSVNDLSVRERNYANALGSINSSLQKRTEAIRDMGQAQETYANKLRTSFNLGQMALGAKGLSAGFSYIQSEQYYRASSEMFMAGYESSMPYAYLSNLDAYTPLIRKAIISAGNIMQSGGNFQDWVLDFGDSIFALRSMIKMEEALENASELNDRGNEYEAWSSIADQTAVGCEILGTMGETASQFYPTPIPVGPVIKPAMRVVGGITSGSLQTLVTAGKLASEARLISAPLGTKQIAGASLVLFSPMALAYNGIANIFGMGEPPAEAIRSMAMAGVSNLAPLSMKFSVELRPTMPSAPNPAGTAFPPIYTNEGDY